MADADLTRAARAVEELLDALGVPVGSDPELEGTPERVARAFAEDLLSGYAMDPSEILSDGTSTRAPGLVVVRDIATTTMCPHHLMPASGVAHVGYLPGERVAGIGALARLVDCYARRLSLQEDLGQHVADALVRHLGARGAGCVLSLSPTCMTARGGRRHGARAITHAWSGTMATDPAARREMLASLAMGRSDVERDG
jgi:GTP cyclohydrolase I